MVVLQHFHDRNQRSSLTSQSWSLYHDSANIARAKFVIYWGWKKFHALFAITNFLCMAPASGKSGMKTDEYRYSVFVSWNANPAVKRIGKSRIFSFPINDTVLKLSVLLKKIPGFVLQSLPLTKGFQAGWPGFFPMHKKSRKV